MSAGENLEELLPIQADAVQGHIAGEATPAEVPAVDIPPPPAFGLSDDSWSESQWKELVQSLVTLKIGSWKDIASAVLGSLNPPQFGTSMASAEGFKNRYGKGKTMRLVMEWAYDQKGKCVQCGSRLDLQADHATPKETFDNPLDADFIENMVFRCRRCNVIRRPSHLLGGKTFLTAESGLMWILFVIRPRTYGDFTRLCRLYGMTMAEIRMEEAWAMAHWLSKETPPAYGIEDDAAVHDLVCWEDNAITRVDSAAKIPLGARRIFESVAGTSFLGFVAGADGKFRFHEYPVSGIPFSTYDLGGRPPQALAVRYVAPDRENRVPQQLVPLAPRGTDLLLFAVRSENQKFCLAVTSGNRLVSHDFSQGNARGVALKVKPGDKLDLRAIARTS